MTNTQANEYKGCKATAQQENYSRNAASGGSMSDDLLYSRLQKHRGQLLN